MLKVEGRYDFSTTRPATRPALDGAWWKSFNDPLLVSLVQRGVEGNLDLRIAEARIREARAYRAGAAAEGMPQVGIHGGVSRSGLSKNAAPFNAIGAPGFPWEYSTFETGFDASWELDLFGSAKRSVEAADADTEAAGELRRAAVLSVVGEVARDYVELRGAQAQANALRENLRVQQETLALSLDRARTGAGTDFEVARSRSLVETTRSQIPQAEARQWQLMHALAVLLNAELEPLADELQRGGPIPLPAAGFETGIPAELLRRRPDIRRAERQLAAASGRTGAATAGLYPRFSLGGSFGVQSERVSDLLRGDSVAWRIGPGINWPIFDGGRLRAALAVRTAQQEQSLLAYEASVRRAIGEVRDAAISYSRWRESRQALEAADAANRDAVRMAGEVYSRGLSDFTAVLDTQRQLSQTQETLARVRTAEATALVSLAKALGGGWEMFEGAAGVPSPATSPAGAPGQ